MSSFKIYTKIILIKVILDRGTYPLGVGQGLTRLLQFSGILAAENKAVNVSVLFNYLDCPEYLIILFSQRLSLAYWDALVKEYFAPHAVMKFTLWKDNQRNEAKPFGVSVCSYVDGSSPDQVPSYRHRCSNPAQIFPSNSTIWCEVDDTLLRWCPRATSISKPRNY